MNPKLQDLVRRQTKALSKNSWNAYRSVIGMLCEAHSQDFPFLRPFSGWLRNGDVSRMIIEADSLVEQQYIDPAQHFAANQFASLIRKYPFPSETVSLDPESKAKETFWLSEQKCLALNQKGDSFFEGIVDIDDIGRMRNFIRYVLGENPNIDAIYEGCDFGPGANIGNHGNATNLARKLAGSWSVTPRAYYHARSAVYRNFHLVECLDDREDRYVSLDDTSLNVKFHQRARVVHYNKIAFVPKTVKTHRAIAVEPLLNTYVQKGIDAVLRRKLLRIGIDLRNQSINSELARQGSLEDSEDSFVTIDLSSASDSISINLARNLLPEAWYLLMNDTRSHEFLLDNEKFVYQKFCSMGNGFCFPLETLLFTAACFASGAGTPGVDFHVYGDDIILRKKYAHHLLSLLGTMGFEVNKRKTFLGGPFRESCGTDWFNGKDVRPFILDFNLGSTQNIIKFLNLSTRNDFSTSFLQPVRDFVRELVDRRCLFERPLQGPPDSGVTVEKDIFMSSPHAKWSKDLQTWTWLELMSSPIVDKTRGLRNERTALMIAALRGASSEGPFTVRRKTRTTIRRSPNGLGLTPKRLRALLDSKSQEVSDTPRKVS